MNIVEKARVIYNSYKPNIIREQRTPENMFLLGCQAGIINEWSNENIKVISNHIVNSINKEFNLELFTVDAAQMEEHIFNYLSKRITL